MTDADIIASVRQAQEWQRQEAVAYASAALYLEQAARGEVPHDEPVTEDTHEYPPL